VVVSFSVIFGVVFALVAWAIGEDAGASFIFGGLGAVLFVGCKFLLWGELRTFWPERRT
jgi:hypothetical protein